MTPSAPSPASPTPADALPERMTQLLQGLVERLVDEPASVRVQADAAEDATSDVTTLRLSVAPDDLGKVIGKQGRTVRSLRTVLSAIGSKANQRVQLDVVEDDDDATEEA